LRSTKSAYRYLLVLQADAVSHLETRIVAPLIAEDPKQTIPILNPVLKIGGRKMILLTEQIVTVPTPTLGRTVANVSGDDYAIGRALDFVLKGI
jgi:mRNA-degrading endonuclease toxin of MazEF toxin-antitoxin module